MRAFKSAQADVKEKIQNVTAKVDEKTALNKASATAKAERKEAENKAGKHDAKANFHTKQAEILREYEQKKANNAAAKEETKTALNQKKADKHTNKADKHANATDGIVGDGKTDENVELNTPATASADPALDDGKLNTRDAPAQQVPAQDELGDRNTSSPADGPERAPEVREEDVNATNPVDAARDPVDHSQVPMHGSGVPVHSTLHSDNNPAKDTYDVRTTQTMGASPNNGSYM